MPDIDGNLFLAVLAVLPRPEGSPGGRCDPPGPTLAQYRIWTEMRGRNSLLK